MPELQTPMLTTHSPLLGGLTAPFRVVIENVQPQIDEGRFPAKRVIGDEVTVTADIHADGHDVLAAVLRYRSGTKGPWREQFMMEQPNDAWTGQFIIDRLEPYEFTVRAWVDYFATWRRDLLKKVEASLDVHLDLQEGTSLIRTTTEHSTPPDAAELRRWADLLQSNDAVKMRTEAAAADTLRDLMRRCDSRLNATYYDKTLSITVDPVETRFSTWYELFPRSTGQDPKRSATLAQAETRLTDIAAMGFSIVYLPPIHPIGRTNRKGPNNALRAQPADPGSPWAIGSSEGGHKAIDPALGTFEDFAHFVKTARDMKLDVALDIAFQCSPDHPYVRDHPEWFRHRADGSIKHAENPPKVYEDIIPFDFECADWPALWRELKSIVVFWIDHGIRIFRVDNPHTKPYRFWDWLIKDIKEDYPETVFLAEAFTRPKVMNYLAKSGFSQSYTYFTWRNSKSELTEYFTQLTQTNLQDFLRPNLFINTPDILPEFLQFGGRPAFLIRLFLAATLGASYGIYGPAFELCEASALPGKEEYLNSEKFEIRAWDLDRPGNIRDWIALVNKARKDNSALQTNQRLRFHAVTNDALLCYSKTTADLSNVVLTVVNLDPHHAQDGWVQLDLAELGLENGQSFQVHDLLSDARYSWQGSSNYVRLDPGVCPAHLFQVRRRARSEKDFDYFG